MQLSLLDAGADAKVRHQHRPCAVGERNHGVVPLTRGAGAVGLGMDVGDHAGRLHRIPDQPAQQVDVVDRVAYQRRRHETPAHVLDHAVARVLVVGGGGVDRAAAFERQPLDGEDLAESNAG